MSMSSKVFILVSVMNAFMFVLLNFGGIDGAIGQGYIGQEGDMFSSGMIGNINTSSPSININGNMSSDNSLIADIESNVEQNNIISVDTFGWSMIKKVFKSLFQFIFMPIVVFSTDYGFPPFVSFVLQMLFGVPVVIAYIISLGMLIFGRATWD